MDDRSRPWLPDFIIIGAQKCGTTSLFHYLAGIEDVHMAREKEVHFFDRHFARGLDWYESRFRAGDGPAPRWLGEATPLYIFHPWAMSRIRETLPGCRLVVVLRNPVDRAYSHYHHEVVLGHEARTFVEAVDGEDALVGAEYRRMEEDPDYFSTAVQRYSYLSRGMYQRQLLRVFDHFPRKQVLVLQSEKLFGDPVRVQGELHAFLGLPATVDRPFPHAYSRDYAPMPSDVRERLETLFRPHNEALFELMGRRFDW